MAQSSVKYSCIMSAKFDWGSGPTSFKETDGVEIYKYNRHRYKHVTFSEEDYPYDVIERKNKVRGQGHAMVLRFESTDGKDFELLGWTVVVDANRSE